MSEQRFVIAPDGRKVPVPDSIPQVTAEKNVAKIRKLREYWDAKLTATPPASRPK